MKPVLRGVVLGALVLVPSLAAASTQQSTTPTQGAKLDRNDPNYVRCKRSAPIGSLIKSVKLCKTNAEWAAITEQQQKDARLLQERNRTGSTTN